MDRPRPTHAGGTRPPGGHLKPFVAVASTAAVFMAACSVAAPDFERIVAMQIESVDQTILVGDTAQLVARAVNAAGNVVDSIPVGWQVVDVDSGQIGFTLDTATGIVVGTHPGAGRVQASLATLRSDPITITVEPDTSSPFPSLTHLRRLPRGNRP